MQFTPEATPPVAAAETPAPPAPTVPEDKAAAPVAEAPAEPVEAAPADGVVVEPPAPVPPPDNAPAPAKAGVSEDEWAARIDALVRQRQSQPEPQRQPEQPPAPKAPPLISEDEQKFLAAYEKDWPDVAKAEAIRRRADLQQVVGYVFQEIAKEFGPVAQTARRLEDRQQIMELRSHVPDYDKIYDPIVNWVASQPPLYRPHLENIVKNGSPDQVVELINTWRSTQGQQPAPSAPVAKAALAPAIAKAAAALAPVGGKRSNVIQGRAETFEDAWKEALAAG